jgi:hypothetical protein
MYLDLDAIPNENLLLLEWAPACATSSPATAGKASEQVLEIEIGSKSTCAKPTSSEWPARCAAEGVGARPRSSTSPSTLIKCSGTKLIPCGLLLRICQELICRLCLCKLFFRCRVLVGVWVVFLCESVVCLFDLGRCGAFPNS